MPAFGKHSQYTRDTYFWHSKVIAERQAFSLSAAFDGKSMLVSIYVYHFPKERERISACAEWGFVCSLIINDPN